jgi:hypothetical protein
MNEIATKEDVQNFRVGSLLDPNYFGRVAAIAEVMAASSLIPETLRTEGNVSNKKALSPEVVRANCFLVTNQALKWGADPFAVAAASSVVHGRLMYEGKLVAAILDANLGVRLDYSYGKWDAATESCNLDELGTGDLLAVRVSEIKGYDADGAPVLGHRYIDGCVKNWKTTKDNSPWREGNYRKMLAYRGAREFSRIHEPGIMVGIITDDEDWSGPVIEGELSQAQPSAASVMERIRASKAAADAGGFDNSRVQNDTAASAAKNAPTGNAAGGEASENATGGSGEGSSVDGELDLSATSGAASSGRDEGASAGEDAPKPSSAAEPKDKAKKVKEAPAETSEKMGKREERSDGPEWLQNVTKMLWAATHFGKAVDVLKAQRKMAAEAYPAEGIPDKYLAKARSVFDRCMDVAGGSLEPDDALDLVSGLSGVLEEDLRKIDADKGRG